MPLIEIVNLCQRYGERSVLKNVNLEVGRGEVLALIGPTGAGKTTLLRLIDLLDTPQAGKIYFDGVDTAAQARVRLELRRRMALVHQKPVVFNTSVYHNVAHGLNWRGVSRSSIHKKVSSILEMVNLSAYQDRDARVLSGGEMQRVAIARAIAVEPELLLLDEPTANLDPVSAAKVEELITGIIKQHVTTVIMATHDMSQGQRLADTIGVLVSGEVLQMGNVAEVFASPRNREVAEFVGVENIIDGEIASSEDEVVTIDVGSGVIEAVAGYSPGTEVSACIRPEEITLALTRLSTSARNTFTGKITRVVSAGPLSRIEVDCGFPLVALVTRRSAEELGLVKGKRVHAAFKATGVHVIKKD